MANYESIIRTNYFRVTDEEKYNELFNNLCAEDTIHDFSYTDDNGVIWHGFGSYGNVYCEEDDDYSLGEFYSGIQSILPADEALITFEIGNEKLRYLVGIAVVVTKDSFDVMDLNRLAIDKAKVRIGDWFVTQTDY